jgi:hypothetical protein
MISYQDVILNFPPLADQNLYRQIWDNWDNNVVCTAK